MLSFNLKSISTLTIASVLAISPILVNSRSAVAQPTDAPGTRGHYIGAGISAGEASDGCLGRWLNCWFRLRLRLKTGQAG